MIKDVTLSRKAVRWVSVSLASYSAQIIYTFANVLDAVRGNDGHGPWWGCCT